jgi:hypothetical protein
MFIYKVHIQNYIDSYSSEYLSLGVTYLFKEYIKDSFGFYNQAYLLNPSKNSPVLFIYTDWWP